MAKVCPNCRLPVWYANTPDAFDPTKYCLARSGAWHQELACKNRQHELLKSQLAAALAVVDAADAMRSWYDKQMDPDDEANPGPAFRFDTEREKLRRLL